MCTGKINRSGSPGRLFVFLITLLTGLNCNGQWVREPLIHASTGTVLRYKDFPSINVVPRTVDVWLPEGYGQGNRYAVLYMHDGQMLFDSTVNWNHQEWGVDEAAGKLIRSGKTNPYIIVGIWNTPLRFVEYLPYKPWSTLTPEEKSAVADYRVPGAANALFPGEPLSDKYLRFIVNELKPAIDSTFLTQPDRDHTFLSGSSMGGLISLYGVCEYPETFGGAACLSTHWTGYFRATDNPLPDAILRYLSGHIPTPGHHRFYFDHGTATLDSLYTPFQIRADSLFRASGYGAPHFDTRVFPGEDHSERAWQRRVGTPLMFLLGK